MASREEWTEQKVMPKVLKMFKDKKVPKWNIYYPELGQATLEQKEFYEHWLTQLRVGNVIDINGNLSYVFVYLYALINSFLKDENIKRFISDSDRLQGGYAQYEKIKEYLAYWKSDAYLYVRDYDKAWQAQKGQRHLGLTDIINFRAKCKDTSIDGQDLMCMLASDNGLTSFGNRHQEQIGQLAGIFLKDFHKKEGINFIEYFCKQFKYSNLSESDFKKLKELYPSEKEFYFWKKIYEEGEKQRRVFTYSYSFFSGALINRSLSSIKEMKCDAIPSIITVALTNEGKRILRECENTIREEKNLPRVGEGWISETELFYKICEFFPEEKVVHHGRPKWLSPQHLDIYFPLRGIGIEYQGSQHQRPVEYFGGEEAFKDQQRRDRRKMRLCTKNKCHLIYAYEADNSKDIKIQIMNLLIDGSNQNPKEV